MIKPLILSTWSFGQRANAAAWQGLMAGGNAIDAVEAACRDAEGDLTNHTVGVGGYPDADGNVSLDASIMVSPARCGAVAGMHRFAHPVTVARAVMEKTPHRLLVGSGAEQFAIEQGILPQDLLTPEAKNAWLKWQRESPDAAGAAPVANIEERPLLSDSHDTIGVLAMDNGQDLAGACSTSGLAFKHPGRVGDSPIIGHGLYVDPAVGAAVATGRGELVMSVCGAFLAIERMRQGATAIEAASAVLERIAEVFELSAADQVGIIVLDRFGRWGAAALRPGFRIAMRTPERDQVVDPERVLFV